MKETKSLDPTNRKCPHCKERMPRDAGTCPHCQNTSTPWQFHDGHWWVRTSNDAPWQWLDEATGTWSASKTGVVKQASESPFKGNCPISSVTEVPFGVLFQPGDKQREAKHLGVQTQDESSWLMMTRYAEPLTWPGRDEEAATSWLYATSTRKPDMEIHGTWLVDGEVRSGLRAKSLMGYVLVTNKAVRLGLGRPDVRGARKGPYVFSDHHGRLAEALEGFFFGAALYFNDIDWVRGGKTVCAFGSAAGAVMMQARGMSFWTGSDYEKVPLGKLATAVTAGLIESARVDDDPARRAGAERLASSDFASGFAAGDALVELVK